MAFDGAHFDPPPAPPRTPSRTERTILIVLAVLALMLLLLPVPFAAVGDIATYLTHRR